MRLRTRGHPWHPALAHFPIALWTVAVPADLLGWWLGDAFWWQAAYWALAAGLAIGALAMLAGFLDYLGVPKDHPAQDTAVWHMMVMGAAWMLMLFSFAGRELSPEGAPPVWAAVLLLFAWFAVVFGGWLGGTLVYRYGVGGEATRDDQ